MSRAAAIAGSRVQLGCDILLEHFGEIVHVCKLSLSLRQTIDFDFNFTIFRK